jgi:RHS repeat-associated protein
MKLFIRSSLIAFYFFWVNYNSFTQAPVSGNPFGYTQGGFGVSDGGAATYSIPFVIPAGTAGLQPKIGLSYSSQSGNSFVGLGWSLTGLSSITRSSKTRAQDETADASQQTKAVSLGIAYNKSDRFSLDGERLVLAPDSIRTNIAFDDNYGNNQTIYYTEQNSFTRVILNENATSQSPQSFKAFTKSGLIFEYGNTTDSRVVDPTKNVGFQWLVNKIEDRKGNYMTFSYIHNSTSGEVYPDEINYTGNVTGGLVPYNKVKFIWEDRPDKSSVYGIRYQQKNTYQKRLKCVQIFYQTTLIREYKLSYDFNQYSLLKQIQECDGSSPQQICFEPTIFNWSNIELGLGTATEVTTVPSTTPEKRLFGDFNGDGLSDIATWDIPSGTNNFVINFYLNNGSGSFINSPSSGSTTTLTSGTNPRIQVGEVNGDNIKDIIVNWSPTSGTNNTLFLVSNPPAPVAGVPYPYTCSYYPKITSVGSSPWDDFIVDINEDGISDFVDYQTQAVTNRPVLNQAKISANLPTNSNTNTLSYYELVSPTIAATGYNLNWTSTAEPEELIEDINNDGLADFFIFDKTDGKNVFVFTESTRTVADYANRKNQFRAAIGATATNVKRSNLDQSWLAGTTNKISLADLNSDNLPDVLVVKPATNQIVIIPNIGDKGFEVLSNHKTFSATFLSTFGNVLPNDFNADGLVDLTFYETTNGTNRTYINEGDFVFNFSSSLIDALPLARFKDTGTNPKPQIGNFLKGSHSDFLYFNSIQNKWFVQRMRQSQGFSIKKITNGAGLSTEIKYDNLLNSELYEKAGQVTFPNVDIQSPLYVVSKIKTITTTGDETAKKYRYCGATINVEGRGFRGFTKIIEKDTITGIYDARYYRQGDDQWKYTGETVIKTERFYPNDVLIARTSHNPTLIGYPTLNPTSFHAYAKEEITEDAVNFKKQKVRKLHDPFGNPTYVVVDYRSINDSPSEKVFKDSTVNVYSAVLPSTWLLGRLTQSTLYRFATGQPTETRQSAFEYDAATGLLNKETSDANLAADKKVVTTYTYDVFGNTITSNTNASIGGAIFQDRTVQSVYDTPTKRFVIQTTNPLGHIATATYDQKFGVPLTQTDPNGLTDTLKYDGFSRLIKQIMADGTWKSIDYRKASVPTFQSPAESVFLTYTQSSNGQVMIEHFDSYNRGVQTKSKGFDGRWVIVDHTYSRVTSPEIREVIKNNFPYYEGETSTGYTQKELDKLGRVIAVRETKTGGLRTATTDYSGLITDFINFKNQKKTDIEDVKDRVVESRWKDGNNVYFTYDAAGRLRYVVDLKGDTITNEYDARGLKIKMKDPNMGTYLYEYNGFGELTKQTYPKGDVLTMTYDNLGRMLTRQDPDGLTTNVYDLGNKGIGKLSSVSSYVFNHSFTYDNLGRKSQESVTVNGQTYTTTTTYDSQSRISTLSYPAFGLVLKHVYNQWGFLTELRNNSNNALFWRLDSLDAKGNITLQSFGNGVKTRQQYEAATQYLQSIQSFYNATTLQHFSYKFNDLAHLTERKDEKRGNIETFDYDEVNRLTATKLNNNTTTSLTYDVLGNILTKSDVGSYEYGTTNNGPHRLVNVRTNNANVQCSFTLNINTVYTSFNKVKTIANDTASVEVFYGPDQQRIMQKMYVRGALTRTKLYIGGITEIETFTNGKTKTTNFIGGIGMQVTETQGVTTTTTLKYYLKDHLGSNTGFTGDNGVLLEEMSFDAWGQRRNADWTSSTAGINTSHERGFTNHEHYDLFAMIDMNGRVYDPVLGRFLQADPYIQDMTDLQALNRYSYMDNNPLSGTDPTGYKKRWWKKWIKPLAIIAVAAVTGGIGGPLLAGSLGFASGTLGAAVISGAAAGLASNVTGTLLNGGGLGDALKSGLKGAVIGGISAGLTFGVGSLAETPLNGATFEKATSLQQAQSVGIKILGHGLVQGTMAEATGGKFSNGFITGAVSGGTENFIAGNIKGFSGRVTASAIVGGVSSELSGGSFTNGAVTGAFIMMFNQIATEARQAMTPQKMEGQWIYERAKVWYQSGNGQSVSVKLSGYDFSDISASDFPNGVGSSKYFQFFTPGRLASYDDRALVLGNVKLTLVNQNTIKATAGYDTLDFDYKESGGVWRNGGTWVGSKIYGEGTPYKIFLTGEANIGSK